MEKGRGGTLVPVNNYQSPYRRQGDQSEPILGITPDTWFSPLQPLPNFAPESVEGRQWDYPVGYNMQVNPRPLSKVSFKQLREIANRCDIMSIIINNRKDQMESREWIIKPVDDEEGNPDDPRIKEMTEFWSMPDKVNTFSQWVRPLTEDLLVIDAPSAYVRRNKGGGIYAVEVMDGATIKLLIDENGRRPLPPSPAFQQTLKGITAVSYTNDELIYMPRNVRSYEPYGRSPVEQTIVTINAAINRAQFNANYYTEGNIPDAIGWLPENFTPAQAAQFTEWWDSMYSGNLSQRRKVKFVPGKGNFQQLQEPELKNVYDDYIARLLCFALGISPQPFVSSMNRATAETAKGTADEDGKAPIENWLKNFINRIIQSPQFFGYSDLEFDFAEKEDTDPKQQADILKEYVSSGILSMDEARERLGEEVRGGISAEPGIITATGFITLEDAQAQTKANIEASKAKPMIGGEGAVGPPSGHQPEDTQKVAKGSKKKPVKY